MKEESKISEYLNGLEERRVKEAIAEGRQKYPKSVIKKGAVLYSVLVDTDYDGKTTIDIFEWHVRSIAKKRGTQTKNGFKQSTSEFYNDVFVYITAKIKDVTWCRQSRKVNDFGWSKSIPSHLRDSFRVGDYLPLGKHTTVNAALRSAIKRKEKDVDAYKQWSDEEDCPELKAEWDGDVVIAEKELRLLKSRLTKIKNAKSKK